jgi:hypothetical protein
MGNPAPEGRVNRKRECVIGKRREDSTAERVELQGHIKINEDGSLANILKAWMPPHPSFLPPLLHH